MAAPSIEKIRDLQQRVRRMEGASAAPDLALLPALAAVMTVRAGTVCSVDTPGLALTLAAGASQSGAWVGFTGLPEVGWEAAADLGIDLDKTVAVPFPGEHWMSVTAALLDVIGVVVVRPPGRVTEAQAARIAARLRQRGAVLIAEGEWPRAALRLRTVGNDWSGLGAGHGHLRERTVRLEVRSGTGSPRRVTLGMRTDGVQLLSAPVRNEPTAPLVAMVG